MMAMTTSNSMSVNPLFSVRDLFRFICIFSSLIPSRRRISFDDSLTELVARPIPRWRYHSNHCPRKFQSASLLTQRKGLNLALTAQEPHRISLFAAGTLEQILPIVDRILPKKEASAFADAS
jgi:hypothetical protein